MFETSGFGQGFDGCEIPLGEITPEDVAQIVEDLVPRLDEELPLCLEITQLQYQMNSGRCRMYGLD